MKFELKSSTLSGKGRIYAVPCFENEKKKGNFKNAKRKGIILGDWYVLLYPMGAVWKNFYERGV